MINAGEKAIHILHADGTKTIFDPGQLQTDIISCALQTGFRDAWFAEDIALAIEHALLSTDQQVPTYSETDVNTIVIKALEETGYPEVSDAFRRKTGTERTRVTIDRELVGTIINKYLQLNGDACERCLTAVVDACRKLGIEEVSPILVLELAKYYKDKHLPLEAISACSGNYDDRESPYLLTVEEILAELNADSTRLIHNGILRINGVSRLFPAVKVDIDLHKFVSYVDLMVPMTEMALFPYLPVLAETIDCIADAVVTRSGKTPENPLPLCVRFVKCRKLMKECFDSDWPDAESICVDLVDHLQLLLKNKIYRTSLL